MCLTPHRRTARALCIPHFRTTHTPCVPRARFARSAQSLRTLCPHHARAPHALCTRHARPVRTWPCTHCAREPRAVPPMRAPHAPHAPRTHCPHAAVVSATFSGLAVVHKKGEGLHQRPFVTLQEKKKALNRWAWQNQQQFVPPRPMVRYSSLVQSSPTASMSSSMLQIAAYPLNPVMLRPPDFSAGSTPERALLSAGTHAVLHRPTSLVQREARPWRSVSRRHDKVGALQSISIRSTSCAGC